MGMFGGFDGGFGSFGATSSAPVVAPQPTYTAGTYYQSTAPSVGGNAGFQQIGGMFTKFAGVMQQQAGANRAASDIMAAAERNAQIAVLNANRKLDEMSREIIELTSTQNAQYAATGFSAKSKSFQAITNDTLDAFTREILDVRADVKREQESIYFEANQRASAIRQQAAGNMTQSLISLFR